MFFLKRILWLSLTLLVPLSLAHASPAEISAGLVHLRITSQGHDQLLPWNKTSERSIQGNAIVVKGRRLVTTADIVKNANLIQVRKFGRYPNYTAQATLVDYDLNLALLEVVDEEFWKDLKPLKLAEKPLLTGRFTINRWRGNGRLEQGTGEVVEYRVSSSPFGIMEFPVMRGNTPMSGLGWSEILTHEGEIIGMVTSHNEQRVQGLVSERLRLFIKASGRKPYRGFAHRGFSWQRLDQANLRAYFGLGENGSGVLVRKVYPGGTGGTELRKGDILHKIGEFKITPEGRVDHPLYGLVPFSMIFNETLDKTLTAFVQRDGKQQEISLKRSRFQPLHYRIPQPLLDAAPDYELFGGLVLRELNLGYLQAWGQDWLEKAPTRLVIEYSNKSLNEDKDKPERVVIISRVLSDPENIGYEDVNNAILTEANGVQVTSLGQFREIIDNHQGAYHTLGVLPGQGRGKLIYARERIDGINERIRERYSIPPR